MDVDIDMGERGGGGQRLAAEEEERQSIPASLTFAPEWLRFGPDQGQGRGVGGTRLTQGPSGGRGVGGTGLTQGASVGGVGGTGLTQGPWGGGGVSVTLEDSEFASLWQRNLRYRLFPRDWQMFNVMGLDSVANMCGRKDSKPTTLLTGSGTKCFPLDLTDDQPGTNVTSADNTSYAPKPVLNEISDYSRQLADLVHSYMPEVNKGNYSHCCPATPTPKLRNQSSAGILTSSGATRPQALGTKSELKNVQPELQKLLHSVDTDLGVRQRIGYHHKPDHTADIQRLVFQYEQANVLDFPPGKEYRSFCGNREHAHHVSQMGEGLQRKVNKQTQTCRRVVVSLRSAGSLPGEFSDPSLSFADDMAFPDSIVIAGHSFVSRLESYIRHTPLTQCFKTRKQAQESPEFHLRHSSTVIHNWKAHVLRAVNQELGKQSALQQLDNQTDLIITDWAMKFLPMKYRPHAWVFR
uniref:Uncharacterized protein n=1 Tax=Branchiostoma floridae TaxID=7739 RepID=C3ZAZ5_BRAFL|eukprot:XP_002594021.1 hypothetical protein BRAFLDRAFT_68539 [Branchiostoma floridae]